MRWTLCSPCSNNSILFYPCFQHVPAQPLYLKNCVLTVVIQAKRRMYCTMHSDFFLLKNPQHVCISKDFYTTAQKKIIEQALSWFCLLVICNTHVSAARTFFYTFFSHHYNLTNVCSLSIMLKNKQIPSASSAFKSDSRTVNNNYCPVMLFWHHWNLFRCIKINLMHRVESNYFLHYVRNHLCFPVTVSSSCLMSLHFFHPVVHLSDH